MNRPFIAFEGITKRFGRETALDNVSLTIGQGEFFALLGPSGCGKTTLMRLLAGFETPDAGRILLDGQDIGGLPPHQRPLNMMFQSYALFPHMSVAQNIAFGPTMAGLSRAQTAARVEELLALVRLEGMGARKPHQLSGGQKQRVALARALARQPKALLLDEPLGALDKALREEMQAELKSLQQRLGVTFLVVTHDQDEALSLADRMGVMDKGRIAETGTPQALYETPASLHVARFLGALNTLPARADHGALATPFGPYALAGDGEGLLAFRPEKLLINPAVPPPGSLIIPARLVSLTYKGENSLLRLEAEGHALTALAHGPAALLPGSDVTLALPAGAGLFLKG